LNHLVVRGQLVQREALRYTPAGVAVVEAVFHHDGEAVEAGLARKLRFDLDVVAVGALALKLAALSLGSKATLTGFLATRSHRSRKLRMHITDFEITEDLGE
jgi:primosomal replication protein N